eukprot:gene15651-18561_t
MPYLFGKRHPDYVFTLLKPLSLVLSSLLRATLLDVNVIRGSAKHPCPQGTPISAGTKFRLQVSCYGDEDKSDTGDIWKFEAEKGSGVWTRDAKVRFVHDETGVYLMSHDKKFGRPIAGQQEVCGTKKKNSDSFWVATEGVYMPDATLPDDLDDEL